MFVKKKLFKVFSEKPRVYLSFDPFPNEICPITDPVMILFGVLRLKLFIELRILKL